MTEIYRNLIDGKWADGGELVANINPSDHSDIIGHYATASVVDVQQSVAAARRASPAWAEAGLEQRKAVLDFVGDELIARSEEIGRVIAREEGKTLAEGKGEAFRSGQFFQYYAAECLRQTGEQTASVRPGVDVEVTREAVGVVGVITPWNFPIAVAAWKIAPALAFGNSVVLKPSETTPASAAILADIIHRSGLPSGAFNMVIGEGRDVGHALAASPGIDAVTFTGSVAVGRMIAQSAIANMARIQLEMGSKNALVVLDDADLDLAVQCAIGGAFFGTGQKCTASSRLVVTQGVHDEFVERMVAAADALVVGHALDSATHIGPVVSERQLQQNRDYLELGKNEGAELATGGELLELATKGNFMRPAIFTNTNNRMRINREEIFGPITSIIKVADYDEALAVSNDTDFGLTSGIMTNSLSKARHFKRHSQSGCVMVNLPTAGTDYHVPFGGRKASSYGPREQGAYAKDFYTIIKTSYIGG